MALVCGVRILVDVVGANFFLSMMMNLIVVKKKGKKFLFLQLVRMVFIYSNGDFHD